MLLNRSIVESSIARAERGKVNLANLAKALGEGARYKCTNFEQRRQGRYRFLSETGDPTRAKIACERVLGGNDLVSINYLARGLSVMRAVCRVRLRNRAGDTIGFGTGFLVAPGVLMTNHHVISGASEARNALAEFDYELDAAGNEKPLVAFEILAKPEPIALRSLDFCLVGVAPRSVNTQQELERFGWLPLDPTPCKTFIGEYLTIIQHPGGERKQICVRENKLLRYDPEDNTLWYATDTVAGSSGSPVFNNSWQVVALHHSGVPETDAQGNWLTVDGTVWDGSKEDELRIKWVANEGMRISRIIECLQASYPNYPLAAPVLRPPAPPVWTESSSADAPVVSQRTDKVVDGELQVTIPVHIAVRVGEQPAKSGAFASESPLARPVAQPDMQSAIAGASFIEKVEVDQSNYNKRTGYRSNFLGKGKLLVPLPKVNGKNHKKDILTFTIAGKKQTELK